MRIKVIDATLLRNHLGDAISEVKMGNIIEVRRRGKGEVALVDLGLLEDWLATQDPAYVASIKQARQEARSGKTVSFEAVYNDLMGIGD